MQRSKNTKCVIINWIALHNGAAYSTNMAESLANREDIDVIAILSKNSNDIERWRKIKGIQRFEVDGYTTGKDFLPKFLMIIIRDIPRIKRVVREYNKSIMYISGLTNGTLPVAIAFNGYPLIYTMHDPEVHNSSNKYIKFCNEYLAKKASQIIILSSGFRNYVMKKFNKRISQINVIPLGFEGINEVNEVNKKLSTSQKERWTLLFFGRIDKYKGLEVLAESYSILKKKYGNSIELIIAGSGDFEPYRHQFEHNRDISIINEWISDDKMEELFMNERTISVLPYTSATQSGVITLAKKYKCPVVATRCGGIIEQIQDGVTGFLIEPNNAAALAEAVTVVIEDVSRTETVVENAFSEISDYTQSTVSKLLDTVVDKAFEE